MLYSEKTSDGGTWHYNPVTDRSEYEPGKSVAYGSSSDAWTYSGIKRDLENYYDGISRDTLISQNFERRIRSIQNLDQRRELENLLDRKLSEYKRNSAQRQQQFEQKASAQRELLIQEYKDAWKSRNVLWKVFHQKQNPKRIDFANLADVNIINDIEEIKKR